MNRRAKCISVEETGIPGENHRPAASHLQTLSHIFVSSTHRLSRAGGGCQDKINWEFL